MMQIQTKVFTNSPHSKAVVSLYESHHTPPHTFNSSAWSEIPYQSFSMNEDVSQMQQQLRFPTPPITPPRNCTKTASELQYSHQPQEPHEHQNTAQQQRTHSVIMKVGHDRNPQYLPAVLPCDTCEEDYQQHLHQQRLQSHNDTPSSGTSSPTSHNEFACEWMDCGRSFESLELLAYHVTLIHAVACLNDGLYYCRWTGCQRTERGFNARYKMLVHVRTHTKEKPHQCHLCDKRFSRAENLKIHIRSHSGEKPYVCTFEGCHKAYSNSSDRFKHTRTHSMQKPYMCKVPGCQKRYTDPSSLRKHVKTFKHSMQIVDFKTTAKVNIQQAPTLNSAGKESRFPSLKQNHKYLPNLLLPNEPIAATTQDSFCLAMEEMCHIEATLNYYPATTPLSTDRGSCWLQETEINDTLHYHHPPTYHHSTNHAMQIDFTMDKPLDLRVKRC